MSTIKKFEHYSPEIDTITKNELDQIGNWSPRHVIYQNKGLIAYKKKGLELIEIDTTKSIPSKFVHYMNREDAELLNTMGNEILSKTDVYNTTLNKLSQNDTNTQPNTQPNK